MTADAMHSGTPRTEKWLEWCNRDAHYKAPEQAYETVCKHVGVMTDFARQLETENAALETALQDLLNNCSAQTAHGTLRMTPNLESIERARKALKDKK